MSYVLLIFDVFKVQLKRVLGKIRNLKSRIHDTEDRKNTDVEILENFEKCECIYIGYTVYIHFIPYLFLCLLTPGKSYIPFEKCMDENVKSNIFSKRSPLLSRS